MGADFWIVLRWWGTLFLVGAVAYPLTKRLFDSWYDQGYFFAKAVGMAVVTWIVYAAGTVHLLPFTSLTILIALFLVFIGGIALSVFGSQVSDFGLSVRWFTGRLKTERRESENRPASPELQRGEQLRTDNWFRSSLIIFLEELFFFAALLFWSWVKGHEPSIRGLEKFMDFGFMQSILNSRYFPPADMWYAGFPINYYYFGHMVVAVLTKFSGLDLAYTFNLMLASVFALTLTMSFSIGKQIGQISGGVLTAFLVTLAGNMQTIYAFTKGYDGDAVKPFWELLGKMDLNRYWYANATRFIPFTIHEFPSYSFVVSDVHGHVLSLPFVLLTIALLIELSAISYQLSAKLKTIFYGFLVAILLMTNALDGPIYFGLLGAVLVMTNLQIYKSTNEKWIQTIKILGVVVIVGAITSLPFLLHFKSFVSGLAVNCPFPFLANTKVGPIIFEGVEKCQHSPLWMLWLLWGFFVYCGLWFSLSRLLPSIRHSPPGRGIQTLLNGSRVKPGMTENRIVSTKITQIELLLLVFFIFSLVLVIFPEFFYFKDIYPMHFRSNTMFKLGYEAFILFSIVSGYTIVTQFTSKSHIVSRKIFLMFLLPLLFLVSIYPIFSVRSYFDSLKTYKGLNGMMWLKEQYPDDYAGILWLNKREEAEKVIVEADGDSYTDYARISAFTGIPTIIGWPVHEWLWRGSYDVVAPRREEVRKIYESQDIDETKKILSAYNVRYIVVGKLEREKYKDLQEGKFWQLGREVFRSGGTGIYETSY